MPKREAVDSIFGEPEDEGDEVIGPRPGHRASTLELPPPDPPAPVVPPPRVVAQPVPVMPASDPFAGVAPPAPVGPHPVPAAPPAGSYLLPAVGVPTPSAAANPWAGFDSVPAPVAPAVVPIPVPAEAPPPPSGAVVETEADLPAAELEDEPPRPSRRPDRPQPAAKASGGGEMKSLFTIGFFLLLPYAVLTTGLAVWGLFIKSSGKAPEGHPLSTIPDNFGEFPPPDRKKVSKFTFPVDGVLPPELRVALGGKLSIGALEVEPVTVEVRPLIVIKTDKAGQERVTNRPGAGAVLRLKITNKSDDLAIYPTDPAFNRKSQGNDHPATGLMVGSQTFWGGPVGWPFKDRVQREYEAAQEADATPLKPKESREYVITTDANRDIVRAVQTAKDGMLWRVQLRRGLVEYRGKEVPVTTVIGVEFKAADVTSPD